MAPRDLLLSSGSLENPPLSVVLEAARAGDYAGITLWPGEYHPSRRRGEPLADLRRRIDDSGIPLVDLDALVAWVGPDDPGPPYYEEAPEPLIFELADALGAQGVNVLLATSPDASFAQAADVFGGICERAAAHELRVYIEFGGQRIPQDIGRAAELVRQSGASNAGLMVDCWHVHYGEGDFSDLDKVPGSLVTGFQLNDGLAERPARYGHATRYARLVPGEGEMELTSTLARLDAIGAEAPITLEVFSPEQVSADGEIGFAVRLAEAARAVAAGD